MSAERSTIYVRFVIFVQIRYIQYTPKPKDVTSPEKGEKSKKIEG